MHWNVVEVKPLSTRSLSVLFQDGTSGTVHFEDSHLTGVFEALRNPEVFSQARVEGGAVGWPGEIDLAPDAMYAAISKAGEWVLS